MDKAHNTFFLSSPVNALVEGLYEENIGLDEVLKHGDFGLGTFNNLDGELVLLDGEIYQICGDGKVNLIKDNLQTPFACATFYKPISHDQVAEPMEYERFLEIIQSLMPSPNIFYAIRIEGVFSSVKVRSVPRQENYRPLVEVAKDQPVFTFENIRGTLAGFHTPNFMSSLNVPGLHLHFISDDRQCGGHLLECKTEDIKIGIQYMSDLQLKLPMSLDYLTTNLDRNIDEDLHIAEN